MSTPRTSPAEVRGLFRRVVAAAEAAGIDGTGWVLAEPARRSCDHPAWMIRCRNVADEWTGGVFLGHTDRDASLTLSGMARALEMVPAREVAK